MKFAPHKTMHLISGARLEWIPENIKNGTSMEQLDTSVAADPTATSIPEPHFTLGAKGNLSQIKAPKVATPRRRTPPPQETGEPPPQGHSEQDSMAAAPAFMTHFGK